VPRVKVAQVHNSSLPNMQKKRALLGSRWKKRWNEGTIREGGGWGGWGDPTVRGGVNQKTNEERGLSSNGAL